MNTHSTAQLGLQTASLPDAIGQSEAFLDFQQHVSRAALVNRPVLVVGERGVGKELVAARLHYLSKRWQGPLIPLNCAALAPALLESELFGHEQHAFTGAGQRRRGRFEAANGGTLFLDEIGLIPMEVQEKILRVVEYGSFERVGSSEPIQVEARIIGATNADLPALAAQDKFKIDLLDRLSFEVLHVPPLRERHGDVQLLAQHFAARMAMELGLQETPQFSEDAMGSLETFDWPGNVRELKNVVERAVYRAKGGVIRAIQFNPFTGARSLGTKPPGPSRGGDDLFRFRLGDRTLTEAIRELELTALRAALEKTLGRQSDAAVVLGISYHQFRALYRRHKRALGEPR